MTYDPVLIEGPASSAVPLDEVRRHLRVDTDDDDGLIEVYLASAISYLDGAGGWLGRALAPQTWREDFDFFSPALRLSLAPILSVLSVTYLDSAGSSQTIAPESYVIRNGSKSPEIVFVSGFVYPSLSDDAPAISVTYSAGYEPVPADLRAAILLMVGDMYEWREAKVTGAVSENSTVSRLLNPYRRGWVA